MTKYVLLFFIFFFEVCGFCAARGGREAFRNLVLIIDYDGCLGAVFPTEDTLGDVATMVESEYKRGGYNRLILVSGSNRQSVPLDLSNWKKNHNGSSFAGLELFNQMLKEKSVTSEIFPLLEQDRECSKELGYHWKKSLEVLQQESGPSYEGQYAFLAFEDFESSWWEENKSQMVSRICDELRKSYEGFLDVWFIDDREDLLQEVSKNTTVPASCELRLVRGFFWCYFKGGISIDGTKVFVEKNKIGKLSSDVISQLVELGWSQDCYVEPFWLVHNRKIHKT